MDLWSKSVDKEIGKILHIATKTEEFYKYDMMEQLGMKTCAELNSLFDKARNCLNPTNLPVSFSSQNS